MKGQDFIMVDYKKLYSFLFNGITDVIGIMENAPEVNAQALEHLKFLQSEAEEKYLQMGDSEDDE